MCFHGGTREASREAVGASDCGFPKVTAMSPVLRLSPSCRTGADHQQAHSSTFSLADFSSRNDSQRQHPHARPSTCARTGMRPQGALDVVKQQSEVLKRDFNDLLNKVRCLNTEVFISGPLPTVRRGDEKFSRLLMLNRWFKDTCAAQSVNFIDNFNIFWERRQLFEADEFCLNKSGVQLLSYNIFDFLRQSPAAPAKDKRRDNPKQQIRQPSGEKLLPPEIRIDHEGQHTERGFNVIILTPTRGVCAQPRQPQQPNMRSLPQPQQPNRRSLPQPQQPNKWSLPQPHQETPNFHPPGPHPAFHSLHAVRIPHSPIFWISNSHHAQIPFVLP
ncbi:hypothetical protein N1851_018111 [Merluccius polli]|uniref:Uncharacterized protein n=1 Tax=Merluccius polli TaxID=89951 RepID=A0AA47P1M8_MERPO|nr:hypothetical protein N1851_018111 [Merluccius polli]